MFNLYNFICQRLTWKIINVYYGLNIKLSRNEKLEKYEFILSQRTNYLQKWLVLFSIWLLLPCLIFFFCEVPICASLEQSFYRLWRAGPPRSAFYGSGLACLPSWLRMVNGGWLISMWSEIFLQMKFIIFQGCPTKQAAFLSWQPTPYNQLLIQPLLHFCIKW